MSTPNRLNTFWPKLTPQLLKKWPKLTASDLETADGEFDRIVDLVKQRYDGVVLTVKEADIRHALLKMLAEAEKEELFE